MKIFLKHHGLTVLWALFILIMCSLPLDSVDNSPLFFPGFDKLTHCGFFFVFVVFLCNGLIRQQSARLLSYKAALWVLITALLFGGLIEILQLTIFTWRSADWSDLFADTVGACMGIFAVMVILEAVKNDKK